MSSSTFSLGERRDPWLYSFPKGVYYTKLEGFPCREVKNKSKTKNYFKGNTTCGHLRNAFILAP